MDSPNQISIFDTAEELALAAAERFVVYAHQAISEHQSFFVALAGGQTPRRVYELLATESFREQIDWSNVHLFFGDERCVPPNHANSNYRMVHETLISSVPIPAANVHRIAGEGEPEESARAYDSELRRFFEDQTWPRFDLVLLGMGEDGHTASLFPGSDALTEKSRWVVRTRQKETGQDRITLTLPVLNHAAHVMFLVAGNAKAARLREVLNEPSQAGPLPAQLVRPINGTLEWLVDAPAAAHLAPHVSK